MGSSNNRSIGFLSRDLLEKIGPQFVLLLFPALCAFAIIFTGESLIISDLAFIFGAILLIEAIYFTYWGLNADDNSSNDSRSDILDGHQGVEFRLECPECSKSFYVLVNKGTEEFECNHCQFTGEIEGRIQFLKTASP